MASTRVPPIISRAIMAWLLIALLEMASGTVRELLIKPLFGEPTAQGGGFVMGCAVNLFVGWLTSPWIGAPRSWQTWVGIIWMMLTIALEVAVGKARGYTFKRIVADFNPYQGGPMAFAMLVVIASPYFGACVRHKMKKL